MPLSKNSILGNTQVCLEYAILRMYVLSACCFLASFPSALSTTQNPKTFKTSRKVQNKNTIFAQRIHSRHGKKDAKKTSTRCITVFWRIWYSNLSTTAGMFNGRNEFYSRPFYLQNCTCTIKSARSWIFFPQNYIMPRSCKSRGPFFRRRGLFPPPVFLNSQLLLLLSCCKLMN